MEMEHLDRIFGALQAAEVRYLVVGGLAVIAHGYVRNTGDIDLVIALDPDNVRRAMQVLTELDYRPKVPVRAADFSDIAIRRSWISEKGMMVFQPCCEKFPYEPIDIFVSEPFDFDREFGQCAWKQLSPDVRVPFVSLEQLLAMKKAAARPQDLADIAELSRDHESR